MPAGGRKMGGGWGGATACLSSSRSVLLAEHMCRTRFTERRLIERNIIITRTDESDEEKNDEFETQIFYFF